MFFLLCFVVKKKMVKLFNGKSFFYWQVLFLWNPIFVHQCHRHAWNKKKEKEREVKDIFEKKFCLGIEPRPPDWQHDPITTELFLQAEIDDV